jgi:hypothetical protein
MKRSKDSRTHAPRNDYALALQNAVSWLGDRYLLAEPVAKRKEEPKPYFAAPPRWFPRSR